MSAHPHQLPLPDSIINDPRARELLCVWACAGEQQMVIAGKTWDDPAAWGILLVDLAKQVAGLLCRTKQFVAGCGVGSNQKRV
jgi:hypothetical protein